LNDPKVQEKIEPIIRQSEVTHTGAGTSTHVTTTISPAVSPTERTVSKFGTVPELTQKVGTTEAIRTGTTVGTGTETAAETQTQSQTQTKVKTAVKTQTQTQTKTQNVTEAKTPFRPPLYPGLKKKKLEELTKEEKEGAIAWKQGFGWWVIVPPFYNEDTAIFTFTVPKGIRTAPNMKSAFSTIQKTNDKVPDRISFDRLGIVRATITRPPRQPGTRTGAIRFTQTSKANQRVRNKRIGKYYVAGNMVSRHRIGR